MVTKQKDQLFHEGHMQKRGLILPIQQNLRAHHLLNAYLQRIIQVFLCVVKTMLQEQEERKGKSYYQMSQGTALKCQFVDSGSMHQIAQ